MKSITTCVVASIIIGLNYAGILENPIEGINLFAISYSFFYSLWELLKDIREDIKANSICDMCNKEIQTQKREDWVKSGE